MTDVGFSEVFRLVQSFGTYQKLRFFGLNCLLLFFAISSGGNMIFSFSAPQYHCGDGNSSCQPNKCCDNCTSYVFDGPFTSIVSEWNLLCERSYIPALVQSMYFVGYLFGSLLSGTLSDAFGRKISLTVSVALQAAAFIGASFVTSHTALIILIFFAGLSIASSIACQYTLIIEMIGPDHRTIAGIINELFWKAGWLLIILVAYFIRDWRTFMLIGAAPGLAILLFWKWIFESPRWLITKGRLDEAHEILVNFGSNSKEQSLDKNSLRQLIERIRESQVKREGEVTKRHTQLDMVRTPKMRKFTLVMAINWWTVALTSYGSTLFISSLAGDLYLNLVYSAILPTLLLPVLGCLIAKFGRRLIHIIFTALSGAVCLGIIAVPSGYPLLITGLALTGRGVIGVLWTTIYLITSELYPTTIRNTAIGTCATFARIGGLVAPYFIMLKDLPGVSLYLPVIIFGCLCILAAIAFFFIPETLKVPLAQSIEEAENRADNYALCICCERIPSFIEEVPVEMECLTSVTEQKD
ncbi:organic cation transporter protein [Nematostella vectensis]|uniref:organic cation transporter protein n=1 Tax=Nematostella vectensis TaxID=45351 RepID=UPI0020774F74|nr:organic cation transporter protein [Nematostella vectensis]